MLGDIIATLDRPEVLDGVLAGLPPPVLRRLEARAGDVGMSLPDFAAGAVRDFVDRASDDLWFQMLTLMRQSEEPGLVAVQTILRWVTEPETSP
jgi:hypothetical protein